MQYVDIAFDCLPLRSVARLDVPLDASPKFRARCERIKRAIDTHGQHNAYYLCNAHCHFHLTNDSSVGLVEFEFEGTALTDAQDEKTILCDLEVTLVRENCDWLTEPAVQWFQETVSRAVAVEFDRYIAAGDLAQTVARIAKIQAESDQALGYLGMGL
jgi:hypothetical protein